MIARLANNIRRDWQDKLGAVLMVYNNFISVITPIFPLFCPSGPPPHFQVTIPIDSARTQAPGCRSASDFTNTLPSDDDSLNLPGPGREYAPATAGHHARRACEAPITNQKRCLDASPPTTHAPKVNQAQDDAVNFVCT